MPVAPVNGIELCYDTIGPDDGEPLVLINGLGSQMIRWPQGFLAAIVAEGFRVVIFDNRDVGLSTSFDDAGETLAYTIADMAADVVGLLDHLGVERAHIVGQSMGGVIAQTIAITYPDRVTSLASIMSGTSDGPVAAPSPEIAAMLTGPMPEGREAAIEADLRMRRLIAGPGFPFDEDAMRDLAERVVDRAFRPTGVRRQMMAIGAAPGRSEALASVRVPTVVIHGTADPLVPFSNGERTAEAVPGAELVAIEGMGHDLPEGAWPQVVGAIARNARKA